MRHLDFVLWLLFYLPLVSFTNYLSYLQKLTYSDEVRNISSLTSFILYISIAILLWQAKP